MRDGLRRRSAGGVKALIGRIRWRTWQPNLFQGAHGYDRRALIADVIAGLTVGVVALPLAMAFGIASGVTPQAGIYTAIVGGFLVSFLGGSRIQIGGPTGAFVVIVAGANALFFETTQGRRLTSLTPGAVMPASFRIAGALSLLSWLMVMYWGRMLPFVGNAF